MERDTSLARRVARELASRRLFAYAFGLAIVTAPQALTSLGVTVTGVLRTGFLAVGLGLMVVTYVAELWVGRNEVDSSEEAGAAPTEADDDRYSTRDRLVVGLAALGVAVGVYVALTVDQLAGILFVGGALLFGQYAFRRGREGDENGDERGVVGR
ncbi:hypothetical protein [Halospeciosus flavus]|uniref:Uncharacterized protein n=1 Tax=Halospeciosus flavus TaxID=3032283 RepID=A0ABD5Z932_9EURY|nr:hypothetical protein [Halospeciosus flavus]